MYLTLTNNLKHLNKEQKEALRLMCSYSSKLYNVALYNVRQYYFQEKKFLTYESNYHLCKENENYKLLQAGVSQQVLKQVDRNFKAFFSICKRVKNNEYRYFINKPPKYKEKDSYSILILSSNAITVKNGKMKIPMSLQFMQKQECRIYLTIPQKIINNKIKEVRIIPDKYGDNFKVQYVYEYINENSKELNDNFLGIDIGLDNLLTCVGYTGSSFIIDGKYLKSINHYWNKSVAKLLSIANKQGLKSTKRIRNLTIQRNNRVRDYIYKICKYIINYCLQNDITKLICGYNTEFKNNINLGKRNNQNFTTISFGLIREHLKILCEKYGLQYIEQEESYTSKASFYDLDEIPIYNADNPINYQFSGKRIKRGLYKSKNGELLNADVNGALNIMRKSKQNFNYERLCRGLLCSPRRIRLRQTSSKEMYKYISTQPYPTNILHISMEENKREI